MSHIDLKTEIPGPEARSWLDRRSTTTSVALSSLQEPGGPPSCTDADTCYAFYVDNGASCDWAKSDTGGNSWTEKGDVDTTNGDCKGIAVWYDKWTPSITGTLIHIFTWDTGADDFWYIQLDTSVSAARFDEGTDRWHVDTDAGDHIAARFLVMATGCLSSRNTPDFTGLDSFQGQWVHTGDWPHEGVDFAGKRIGIIGTGSSAIQATPLIAEEAEHLTLFQRTPNYSIPAHSC